MIAIILAAGMGRRLKSLTLNQTKCMIKVAGERLIDRMIEELKELNLSKIVIVTGHKSSNLCQHLNKSYPDGNIEFIHNDQFETTNNIYSLWLARDFLAQNDSIILESDLIFEQGILPSLIENTHPNLSVVAKFQPWMSGTMLTLDKDDNITQFIPIGEIEPEKGDPYFKTVNIHKFSKEFSKNRYLPFLNAYIEVFGKNEFYEQVLSVLSILDKTGLKGYILEKEKWFEIDDQQDLLTAETLFAKGDIVEKYKNHYGGYWRFPGLLDFCYLVNPFFPTKEFKRELKLIFDELLCSYPSGRKINDSLAANLFGINRDYICIANGASELIRELGFFLCDKKIGVIYPTFEEYTNSFPKDNIIPYFCIKANDFDINLNDLFDLYNKKEISVLVLINPNIPTGALIDNAKIYSILNWAKERHISVIIDESFMDFTEKHEKNTFFTNENLLIYNNLIIVKSISKTYGIPGLRLGVLATADPYIIKRIRERLPIWNINSFAEHFLQIAPRYEIEFKHSCIKIISERERMYSMLSELGFLKIFPSESNFFLCEIRYGITVEELVRALLVGNNILVKDCSGKTGLEESSYIRIAIRNSVENDKIIEILKDFDKRLISTEGETISNVSTPLTYP